MSPKVSIITPAFRVSPYIRETIRSVQEQTFTDWEMIIADDGSPDDTVAVAREAAGDDSRIRIHPYPPARSPAITRNRALSHAKGNLIAFLDADDLFLPTKLERQLAALGDAGWCFSNADHFWADKSMEPAPRFKPSWHPKVPFFENLMLSTEGVPFLTVIASRRSLEAVSPSGCLDEVFDVREEIVEDWDLVLRLARYGEPSYLSDVLARYREHSGGVSKAGDRPFVRAVNTVEKMRSLGADGQLCNRARRLQESKVAVARLLADQPDWRGLLFHATATPPRSARDLFFAGLSLLPAPLARQTYKVAFRSLWRSRG